MKNIAKLCNLFLLHGLFMLSACTCTGKSYHFVGMSRADVVKKHLIMPDTVNPRNGELNIMIGIGPGCFYFKNADDLMNNEYVMSSDRWIIKRGFRKNLFKTKTYYYEIIFQNDIVTEQKVGWISDL